jgi:hypothetical protein
VPCLRPRAPNPPSPAPDVNGVYVIPLTSLTEFSSFNFGKKLGGDKARELYQFHDWMLCGVVSAVTPIYRVGKDNCAFSFRIHDLNAVSIAAIIFGDDQLLTPLATSLRIQSVVYVLNPVFRMSKEVRCPAGSSCFCQICLIAFYGL